jgi:hypothetical protein
MGLCCASAVYQQRLYNVVIPDLRSLPRTRYGGIQSFQSGFPLEFTPYLIRGGNDSSKIIVKPLLRHCASGKGFDRVNRIQIK